MAAVRTMTNMILREFIHHPLLLHSSSKSCQSLLPCLRLTPRIVPIHSISRFGSIRCAAASTSGGSVGDRKVSSRLSQVQQMLHEAEERASSAGDEPTPQITLDHVTLNFARSGGPGGQNVNKLNTKVDMRFNVKNAYWLSDRIRQKILLTEKNRINKDGELVISSTKTRTQKGNIDDALEKLQAIIDAASYVPPPPSEEQKKKIVKMAAKADNKRLKSKKVLSDKKSARRSRGSYDD
ncbi:PREDICTED: peptidyl-tRNA hydrolase ICT1, mitochondrial-like [Camelina sativa]|uniref:Peptidyl-tRNA hydrolase ICT1, mitochondrial-like n=1 Tax=Camelina sativa TaxID=90675 RepID=A0ABM0WN51_CAMSA|nr:PREDICTED: peptidyl-tRNA hydrolase ICT1, mitochondrial-like [Camelina sativa]